MEGNRTSVAAEKVLEAFRTGAIVQAAQLVVIPRKLAAEAPSRKWTFRNRICAALSGSLDARTFQQWIEVNRQVRKGERSKGFILLPVLGRTRGEAKRADEVLGEIESVAPNESTVERRPRAFVGKAVFGYHQTDGEPIPGYDERGAFLDGLPLIEVARAWGIEVQVVDSLRMEGALAHFSRGDDQRADAIRMNVENPAVFLHELCHASESRLGKLEPGATQKAGNEIVAEFGSQILLAAIGLPSATDTSFSYLQHYADLLKLPVEQAAMRFLDRTAAAVELILSTAEQLGTSHVLAA